MTERDLGRALLDLDVAPPAPPDPHQLTRRVLDRDRRRLRRLSVLTIVLWVVTAVGVLKVCPFYLLMIAPRLRAYGAGRADLANDWNAWATVGEWAAYWILACTISCLLAALCTVALVVLSRRATLRQINAALVEISEQLRQLRSPVTAPPADPAPAG